MSTKAKTFDVVSGFQIAEGYAKSARLLMKYSGQNSDNEVLQSIMVLKGIALEVYLKCLYFLDHEKAYDGHDMRKLYESLSEKSQSMLEDYFEESVEQSGFIKLLHSEHQEMKGCDANMDLDHVLGEWAHAFNRWRFFYEPEHKVSFLAFAEIRQALCRRIGELKPDLVASYAQPSN